MISRYNGLSHGHAGLAPGYGENLYWNANSRNVLGSGSQGVKAWYQISSKVNYLLYIFFFFDVPTYKRYDEVKYYNFNSPGFSGRTGHFTQVVWKSTTLVGCARCGGWGSGWYETYVVCNYRPAGNIVGDNNRYFRENVLPK